MSEESLYRNLFVLDAGIGACLEQKNALCALILLYSAIDTVGWLAGDTSYATRSSFIAWVDRYLLPTGLVSVSSGDLYAARCGLLHTFSPNSTLADGGAAKRICYAWGDASLDSLERAIEVVDYGEELGTVHVSDLRQAWRQGLAAFVGDLDADPELSAKVHAKADGFFASMTTDELPT